jgi:diadenylate cyclase
MAILDILKNFTWLDFLDISIVTFLIYQAMMLLRGARMVRLLTGLCVLLVLFLFARVSGLATVHRILDSLAGSIILIIVIIYQHEIRRAFFSTGKRRFVKEQFEQIPQLIEELALAADALTKKKIGALIVIEGEMDVDDFIEVGTEIDAKVTCELITSIFLPYSPIHDGAVIVQKGKLTKAGCFLPLTRNPLISKTLGTRHRAALGLAERTDAIVIVVSEETGKISVAADGRMTYDVDHDVLCRTLKRLLESRRYGWLR